MVKSNPRGEREATGPTQGEKEKPLAAIINSNLKTHASIELQKAIEVLMLLEEEFFTPLD